MRKNLIWQLIAILVIAALTLTACTPAATPTPEPAQPAEPVEEPTAEETEAPAAEPVETEAVAEEFTFGIIMVGPYNDHGWSEASYNGGLYVEKTVPGTKMIYVDKVNSADRPGTTGDQLAEELVAKGAKLIIFNSDDFKDASVDFSKKHPEIPVLHISGDYAWKDGQNFKDLPNYANAMGQMEYGEMIGGCAAALTTQTGKIGYVGPLINDETRRFANAFFLGAKYCWTQYLQKKPEDLKMKVTWIGFWFNIPGVTADPTQVSDEFLAGGYDVLVSALDTMEALVQTDKAVKAGKQAWAVAYDYEAACDQAPDICLGVRYFNWGPAYVKAVKAVQDGTFAPYWDWNMPDWSDINNKDTSALGYIKGKALSEENAKLVDQFISELAGGLNLWKGPMNWQDGSVYLKDGEEATPTQIWYSPMLIEGIEGQSVAE
jgi:simple sugar transport system substrate-binding protein